MRDTIKYLRTIFEDSDDIIMKENFKCKEMCWENGVLQEGKSLGMA